MNDRKRLGLALCGSYCTYEKLFAAAEALRHDYELIPIMSDTAAETDTRFGTAAENIRRLAALCGRGVITTIAEAEPLQNAKLLADGLHIPAEVKRGSYIHVHELRQRSARPRLVRELYIVGLAGIP